MYVNERAGGRARERPRKHRRAVRAGTGGRAGGREIRGVLRQRGGGVNRCRRAHRRPGRYSCATGRRSRWPRPRYGKRGRTAGRIGVGVERTAAVDCTSPRRAHRDPNGLADRPAERDAVTAPGTLSIFFANGRRRRRRRRTGRPRPPGKTPYVYEAGRPAPGTELKFVYRTAVVERSRAGRRRWSRERA